MRHGVCLADLDGEQREAALRLLRETLSASGYQTARDVMRLNQHALEITGKPDEYGEWFYWVTIFGTPAAEKPWGWQIDGHHLNVNCFVVGDQLVVSPSFMGSEPVLARFGKYQGTRVFAAEEEEGHALMRSLSPGERHRATMSAGGYQTARDVMRLNEHALEITGKPDEYGEWFYWVSIFGTPAADSPWGWQIDGHHLNVNCLVVGDQLVLTPTFMGSEPVLARFGKYKGTRVFAAEEEAPCAGRRGSLREEWSG